MKQFTAFTKKELYEQLRTGKLVIFTIIFTLFGIMNPAIAKLTPWMMEMMSDQLAETGMIISQVEVNALASWTQYFKNMPIALIILIVAFGGTLTGECQKGTLILLVTKGLKRWKVLAAKAVCIFLIWTFGCLLSYTVTYGYNAVFWDNSIASHLFFAAFCFYLMGLWLFSVLLATSAAFSGQAAVILAAGCAFAASYVLGLFPDIHSYLPTHLMDSAELLAGTADSGSYTAAVTAAIILIILNICTAIWMFNKRSL